jgi:hypothetical protein
VAAIALFLRADEELPTGSENGDGWVVRTYASLDNVRQLPIPEGATIAEIVPIRWEPVLGELPGYGDVEEALKLIHNDLVISEDELEQFVDFVGEAPIENYRDSHTKVGGYAADIQSGAGARDFAFQLSLVGDALPLPWLEYGIAIFHRSAGRWRCEVQLE